MPLGAGLSALGMSAAHIVAAFVVSKRDRKNNRMLMESFLAIGIGFLAIGHYGNSTPGGQEKSSARAVIDSSSRRVREAYRDAMLDREDHLDALLRRAGVDDVCLSTDRPYVHDLVELFHRRERQR